MLTSVARPSRTPSMIVVRSLFKSTTAADCGAARVVAEIGILIARFGSWRPVESGPNALRVVAAENDSQEADNSHI